MRVLVVGLDGVCFPVLDPMIGGGLLPNIAKLKERSAVAPLESQLPPWTPSAWPSLYTGVNPGKHGVYDFLHFDGYDWDLVNRSHVKEHAIWELLSMEGYSSVVLNVPVTNPPIEFDGVLVPGYMAPESPTCHPNETWEELNEQLGEYSLYNVLLDDEATEEERKSDLTKLVEMRGHAFCYLVGKHDPDFGFVQFQQCDTVFHEFPEDTETIQSVYTSIDEQVGSILDACDPDVTLLVSDHGIGPMEGYEFRVNNYLRDEGFVTTTIGESGMPAWKELARNPPGTDEVDSTNGWTSLQRVIEGAARVGFTSQRIATVLDRLGLKDLVLRTVPIDLVRSGTEQVDFPSSIAYMRSRPEMGVRLNVEGREPNGVVSQTNYEEVRTAVIDSLKQVDTPDGDPVFSRVCPREEVFEGPYMEDAPDIVTVPNRFDHYLRARIRPNRFAKPFEPWEHKLEGVVMISGEDIDQQKDISGAHLFDITPTILALFDLAIGERMDGAPIPVVTKTGKRRYPTFTPDETVMTEDSNVERRLADLGYLE